MRKYIVIRFNSVNVGTVFMLTYDYPSAFIVDNDLYDKNGDLTTLENYVEMSTDDIRDVITNPNHFIESVICYDGNNLFIDKII